MRMTRVLIAGIAALSAALGVGFTSSARADTVIIYNFSSGAGYSGAQSANLSGTFSWDATTNTVVSSNIDLSGSAICSDCTTGLYDGGGEYFAANLGSQALYITFANSLSLGGNDALALSAYGGANSAEYQGGSPFSSVTGSAMAVPEPATWAMMLFGIGMVGGGLRMARRKNDMAPIAA
jgi:hypothetical protein